MRKRLTVLLVVVLYLVCCLGAVGDWSTRVVTLFYWGNETISRATWTALDLFSKQNGMGVVTFGRPDEEAYQARLTETFKEGNVEDVVQLSPEMLRKLTVDATDPSAFENMEKYMTVIDLTQFSFLGLEGCTVKGQLCAVPVSMTSHVFFWNQGLLGRWGQALPQTSEQMMLAGNKAKAEGRYLLGADALGRMALMVTYLQSRYGLSWVEPAANRSGFSLEQVAEGMAYLRRLEQTGALSPFEATEDMLVSWQQGRYAGLWTWDSRYDEVARGLPMGDTLACTARMNDWGPYDGGFEKVLSMLAIPAKAREKTVAANLVQYLLNSEEGAQIMADLRGTPDSKIALQTAKGAKRLSQGRTEANLEALSWPRNYLPQSFEAAMFVEAGGVYEQVLAGLSQGKLSPEAAAAAILSGLRTTLGHDVEKGN